MPDSFGSVGTIRVGDRSYRIRRLQTVEKAISQASRLPFALKILLENLLRHEDGRTVQASDIEALARWDPRAEPAKEIAFNPARVLLQDFTGVPAIVDLAAMREAMKQLGGDPKKINPIQPAELVIDHSVQVDEFGSPQAMERNSAIEYERNRERYAFLRWGQKAFANFRVVPPSTGIVHQVNLEYLARVVFSTEGEPADAYPDTLVGTDSHTTMINGLGVLGWGVGGIEAEAAMLGQPVSMLIPKVVGFHLRGQLADGATATDLVLTITEMLRRHGVVGKFVEFFGEGLASLSLADRATIANMAPEYGATCGIFPIDAETLRYLRFTGRPAWRVALVEAYAKEQGLFHTETSPAAEYSETVELDLSRVEPSVAGPSRPQDRIPLSRVAESFKTALHAMLGTSQPQSRELMSWEEEGGHEAPEEMPPLPVRHHHLDHGHIVIAAITSCTNTSNPSVMLAAGLLAKKAVERGLQTPTWVKTSLAPGSKVVTDYLREAGLMPYLERLRFHLVGYGCTTCIGNSGPLPKEISQAIEEGNLVAVSVLSGNRNFEGRVHSEVRANYLMSPPLVVAYALAGRIDIDITRDPIGYDAAGDPVYLKDIWPSHREVQEAIQRAVRPEMFEKNYAKVFEGDDQWRSMPVPQGELYAWDPQSTYVKLPPYFQSMTPQPPAVQDIRGGRVLALLGDSITTDHISPAGAIKPTSPAGKYLIERGVAPKDFNSYGSRRGNHEVMMRGTFANVRLRNRLAPGTEGGFTRHFPDGEQMTIFDASERYRAENVPLLVIAGKEYGSGSSRDWAAKGPKLLGVRAVIAESFERIHRSNLVGMGILPLQFRQGDNANSLELTGEEVYDIVGLAELVDRFQPGREIQVTATARDGRQRSFPVQVRIDTPQEAEYYRHGGILHYVLRQLISTG